MKIPYFEGTDTRNLDENKILDLDAKGNICSIAVEHALTRAYARGAHAEHQTP